MYIHEISKNVEARYRLITSCNIKYYNNREELSTKKEAHLSVDRYNMYIIMIMQEDRQY